MQDEVDMVSLEAALHGVVGGPVRYVAATGSTNSDALEWAADGAPEGAMVIADYQSAGRGRWGRSWAAPAGSSLLFSVVLRPPPDKIGLLTTLAGVACCAGVREGTGLTAGIKWPNDIILRGRKAAGILVETRVLGTRVEAAIVGIGVNVSTRQNEWPPELVEGATSIARELGAGRGPDRTELLITILRALETRYSQWSPEHLLEEASALSVVLGKGVRVLRGDGQAIEGVARRLTSTGALEIETPEGTLAVDSGEIQRLLTS